MTEDSALVCTLVGGGLDVRFLSRRLRTQEPDENEATPGAVTTAAAATSAEPPALPVPKKTKLYVEFARRERDNAPEMYNAFQQCVPGPLCVLNLGMMTSINTDKQNVFVGRRRSFTGTAVCFESCLLVQWSYNAGWCTGTW